MDTETWRPSCRVVELDASTETNCPRKTRNNSDCGFYPGRLATYAIKDKNFDWIRNLPVAETRPEHFDRTLADAKVSTNVYLCRIHNHALGMDWLLKPVIPRLQWPRPVFKPKRAITAAEHVAIISREINPERRDFYELLWHTGAAQTDAACLTAEDINWDQRTICYSRKKPRVRVRSINL
jgi:hypothetical protein